MQPAGTLKAKEVERCFRGLRPIMPPHTDDWGVGAVPVHICVTQTDYIEQDRKYVPRGYPAAFQFVGGFVILNVSVSASPEKW